jgi:hypothetical protein
MDLHCRRAATICKLAILLLKEIAANLSPAILPLRLLSRPGTRIALGGENVGQIAEERHSCGKWL